MHWFTIHFTDYVPHREMTRIASLNAEIETFKAQCARLQHAENASKAALAERLLPSLSELREDLRAIEAEFLQLAPRQEEELQARRQEKVQEIAALESKAHHQSDALEEQRRRHAERMDEVEQKFVVRTVQCCGGFGCHKAAAFWRVASHSQ
jgi:chromosome segregation ATPase